MDDIQNYQVIESLRDQRTVTIRAIRPDDKGLIVDALNTVSAESIYRRFLGVKKGITPQGLKLVTEVDFVNVVALVAVMEKEGNDQIAGGGRYVRTESPGTGPRAEVAFFVGDAFQGLGIASRLFKHLLAIARQAGIAQFEAEVLPSNQAMFKVFARSGIPITKTATRETVHLLMELTEGGTEPGGRAAAIPGEVSKMPPFYIMVFLILFPLVLALSSLVVGPLSARRLVAAPANALIAVGAVLLLASAGSAPLLFEVENAILEEFILAAEIAMDLGGDLVDLVMVG